MLKTEKLAKKINWTDLKEKGYLVIPSFLNEDELSYFINDYNVKKGESTNHMHDIPDISKNVINSFSNNEKVKNVLKNAQAEGIQADMILGGNYFPAKLRQKFNWHQDSDTYYYLQNHYDYLNFYIPIIKPDKEKSNLNIIPFDLMKEVDSTWYEKTVKRGAVAYTLRKKWTKVYDDDLTGKLLHKVNFNINDIAYTPKLAAGDLLIMRGDLVHATQDVKTKRVSISVRFVNGSHLVDRDRLIKGTLAKVNCLIGYPWMIKYMISVFKKYKKDKISVRAFLTQDFGVTVKTPSRLRLALEILFLKFKLGYPKFFKNKF